MTPINRKINGHTKNGPKNSKKKDHCIVFGLLLVMKFIQFLDRIYLHVKCVFMLRCVIKSKVIVNKCDGFNIFNEIFTLPIISVLFFWSTHFAAFSVTSLPHRM